MISWYITHYSFRADMLTYPSLPAPTSPPLPLPYGPPTLVGLVDDAPDASSKKCPSSKIPFNETPTTSAKEIISFPDSYTLSNDLSKLSSKA